MQVLTSRRQPSIEPSAPSAPVPYESAALMEVIGRIASDPNADVAKLERMVAMYERITAHQSKALYDAALAEMQAELPVIVERGEIKINQNAKGQRYALWEDINEAIKPVLVKHGFALSFRTGESEGKVTVTGILSHRAGHREETTMRLPIDTSGSKNAVQSVGSSTSYGKRYTASALLNLTSRGEDDDGQAATGFVTAEQVAALQTLIDDAGADVVKLCAFLKVDALVQITARDFPKAVDAIGRYKVKAAAKSGAAR